VRLRHHHARRRRTLDRHRHVGLVTELPTERFELDAASRRALGFYAATPEAPPPAFEKSRAPDLLAGTLTATGSPDAGASRAGSLDFVSWEALSPVDEPTAPNARDEVAWQTGTHAEPTPSPADRAPAPVSPAQATPDGGGVSAMVSEPLDGRKGLGELESPRP
jgi:hypothetical protein